MKATDTFKKTIEAHLALLAEKDELFAQTFKKENKNIDDCINYIFQTVKKSGCNGFADEEIFNMAVHYYDEDDIKPGKAIKATVVVNHTVEITEEEKQEAKQKALDKITSDEAERLKKKSEKLEKKPEAKKDTPIVERATLFDL